MPRYFFHVHDGTEYLDDEGTELPDVAAAQRQSIGMATELVGNENTDFWDGQDWHLEVTDAAGRVVFTLNLSGTVHPTEE